MGSFLRTEHRDYFYVHPTVPQPTLSSLPYSRLGRRGSRCTCIDWGVEFLSLASLQYTLTWTVDALQGSRNAFFMLPGTRFSWFPKRPFMVPETTFHGSRNDLHGSRNGFHGSRNAFMVPETWFPNRRAPAGFPKIRDLSLGLYIIIREFQGTPPSLQIPNLGM